MNQIIKLITAISAFIKNKIKSQSKKKTIENTVILIIIGIIIVIAGGTIFKKNTPDSNMKTTPGETGAVETAGVVKADEKSEIEKILSQIEGAGNVNVMITYISGSESVPAYNDKSTLNETVEKDNGGVTINITQYDSEKTMVFEENGSIKKPVITKELTPVVKGVVIVADGAGDIQVRERLAKAVQVLLDVPIHKVQVYKRNNK
jgi:stage III sporulation protein AG